MGYIFNTCSNNVLIKQYNNLFTLFYKASLQVINIETTNYKCFDS